MNIIPNIFCISTVFGESLTTRETRLRHRTRRQLLHQPAPTRVFSSLFGPFRAVPVHTQHRCARPLVLEHGWVGGGNSARTERKGREARGLFEEGETHDRKVNQTDPLRKEVYGIPILTIVWEVWMYFVGEFIKGRNFLQICKYADWKMVEGSRATAVLRELLKATCR